MEGLEGQPLQGRLRFRVYSLHESEGLDLDINGMAIPDDAIIERRKTNIHVAAERRYPGMHIPPHIAYEIDVGWTGHPQTVGYLLQERKEEAAVR